MSARYYEAVGRRKTSSARVRLYPGTGTIVVNERPFSEYFPRETDQLLIARPLQMSETQNSFNVSIQVNGGKPSCCCRKLLHAPESAPPGGPHSGAPFRRCRYYCSADSERIVTNFFLYRSRHGVIADREDCGTLQKVIIFLWKLIEILDRLIICRLYTRNTSF